MTSSFDPWKIKGQILGQLLKIYVVIYLDDLKWKKLSFLAQIVTEIWLPKVTEKMSHFRKFQTQQILVR